MARILEEELQRIKSQVKVAYLCREAIRQYSYPEGRGDDGSELKAAYEYHSATGLKFELLWEG